MKTEIFKDGRGDLKYICIILALIFSFGCSGKQSKVVDTPEPSRTFRTSVTTESGISLNLDAKSRGNRVYISLTNNTPSSLRVSPYFFGLIIDNKKPAIHYSPSNA